MQGKGLSDQQAKFHPQPGNRLPEAPRLPEQWQPTDDDLLRLILRQPLITLIELLRELWPALPYRDAWVMRVTANVAIDAARKSHVAREGGGDAAATR